MNDINPGLGGISEEEWCNVISRVSQQESIDRLLFKFRNDGIDALCEIDWSDVDDREFQSLLAEYKICRDKLEKKIKEFKHGS